MPDMGGLVQYKATAALRKKIKGLQLEVAGLRLVTEVLWEASEIRSGRCHFERDSRSGEKKEKQLARVVAVEMKRLREMFPRCGPL